MNCSWISEAWLLRPNAAAVGAGWGQAVLAIAALIARGLINLL